MPSMVRETLKRFDANRKGFNPDLPRHRRMAYLRAQGLTHAQVAAAMGATPRSVQVTLGYPTAREFLQALAERTDALMPLAAVVSRL